MDIVLSGLETLFVLVLGVSVGSFLNVVIYRIPAGMSLLHPPSRCPSCRRRLKSYDNVPVLGWLWLRGRCRYCRTPISIRYPLVEATTGLLFLLVFWSFQLPLPALGYWAFFSWLLALALIDVDTLTLPNPLIQSGLITGLVFQLGTGWAAAHSLTGGVGQLMAGIVGAVVGIWVFDAVTVIGSIAFGQTAMGGGDAKLAAMLGAWLGWKLLLLAGFLACAIGAFAGGGAIALGVLSRRQAIPFGPFLALGGVLAVVWGEKILALYMQIFFPML